MVLVSRRLKVPVLQASTVKQGLTLLVLWSVPRAATVPLVSFYNFYILFEKGICITVFYKRFHAEITSVEVSGYLDVTCCAGTHTPYACDSGTWSNSTRLETASDCTPCPGGWYCQQHGLTQPEGLCMPGYYCPLGQLLHIILSKPKTMF